jgi:hypothetical protein
LVHRCIKRLAYRESYKRASRKRREFNAKFYASLSRDLAIENSQFDEGFSGEDRLLSELTTEDRAMLLKILADCPSVDLNKLVKSIGAQDSKGISVGCSLGFDLNYANGPYFKSKFFSDY